VQKNYLWVVYTFGGGALSLPVLAQSQADPVGLIIDGAVEVRAVENAGLQPKSADNINETQTTTSLAAEGRLQGSWSEFLTNYRLEDRRYSEFKEDDERIILGDSVLTLGPQRRHYYFQLSHSSREVALDPLAADRPTNRDNRAFISGVLYGSIAPGQGNTLGVWLSATDIQFDESLENEARRYNVGVVFDREVSPLSRAGLSATGYDLEYQNLDDSDLRYTRVAATWRTELRRLSYGAEVGSNRIETDSYSYSSPSVAADLAYVSGLQSMQVSYNQFLSDTSQGAQSSSQVTSITDVEVDGRLAGIVDQYKLQQFAFSWEHAQICSTCTMNFALGLDQERYVSFPELDSRELTARAGFIYRATPAVTISLQAAYRDFEEINLEPRSGYDQTSLDFTTSFPRLIRNGQLALLLGGIKRNSDTSEGYETTYVGLRFSYRFYDNS
jgi:hypothetical protein